MASHVALRDYKVTEITLNNKFKASTQFNFSNNVSHSVKHGGNNLCEATLTLEVKDKSQPDILNVRVCLVGVFQVIGNTEKEFIHVETFKELFPFAKALVTTVTANAGIKPIIAQNVDIEKEEIYRWNVGGNK